MSKIVMRSGEHFKNIFSKSYPGKGLSVIAAFTLLELLVVVSIIVLLISLTLAVVQSVRASAHTATCLSNQRQMTASIITYAMEHQGFMPVSSFSNWDRSRWPLMVAGNYLITNGAANGNNDMRNVLVCAADTRPDPVHGTANAGGLHMMTGLYADGTLSENLQWIRVSYCFNIDAFSNGFYPSPPDLPGHAIPARLGAQSATKALFWDSWTYASAPSNGDIYGLSRHRNGINMTFPDGSARLYDFSPALHGEAWNYVNWYGSNGVYNWWGPNEPRRLLGPHGGAKWMDDLNSEPWK